MGEWKLDDPHIPKITALENAKAGQPVWCVFGEISTVYPKYFPDPNAKEEE
jgi:hypothetical protein